MVEAVEKALLVGELEKAKAEKAEQVAQKLKSLNRPTLQLLVTQKVSQRLLGLLRILKRNGKATQPMIFLMVQRLQQRDASC